MARFAAAVDWGRDAGPAPDLERARRALTLGGSRESLFQARLPGFAALLATHEPGAAMLREPDGALVLAGGRGLPDDDDLEFLRAMAAWLRGGEGPGPGLGGRVRAGRCLLRWDPARRELLVVSEPNGLAPVYLGRERGRVVLASEPKGVAALARESLHVDPDALVDLCSVGECLGGRTLFREVTAVPPGVALVLGEDGTAQREWYAPRFSEAVGGDVGRAAASLNEALLDILAAERRARPRATVALSGGMDSRYLLAGARRVWDRLEAVTFGPEDSPDVRGARDVTRRAGVPHRVVAWDAAALARWAPFGVWRTDGMLSCLHQQGMDAVIAAAEPGGLVLNGMGGDFLTGAFMRPSYLVLPGDAAHAAGTVLARYAGHSRPPGEIFKPELLRDCRSSPEASLRGFLGRRPAARLGNALLDFWTRQHCPRFTALGLSLEAPFVEYATPLADPRFIETAAGLSLEQRFLGRAYRRALTLLDPDLAGAPCTRYGGPPARPWPLIALRGALRRGRRMLGVAPGAPCAEEYLGPARAWMRELLLDVETVTDGFFLPDYLAALADGRDDGGVDRARELGSVLALELWRRMFLAGRWELATPPVELPQAAPPSTLFAVEPLPVG